MDYLKHQTEFGKSFDNKLRELDDLIKIFMN